MNYYIKGDAAKAEQIKAAFEKLGIDASGYDFGNDNFLFFTYDLVGEGKVITTTNVLHYFANIIKTHPDYKELELPVEPKFKVGDWLVYKDGGTFCGGLKTVQVQTVERNMYVFTHGTNGAHRFIDSECRLWTIQDAKDGDVLSSKNGTFIFKEIRDQNIISYGGTNTCGFFIPSTDREVWTYQKSFPATKAQLDLLFVKMKEAGYKWDADKKELRKIQPHYDIANFKVGMPVLVRDENDGQWNYTAYSYYDSNRAYKFMTSACQSFVQCIPFNDNTKHLLGTTDMPSEEYINW